MVTLNRENLIENSEVLQFTEFYDLQVWTKQV